MTILRDTPVGWSKPSARERRNPLNELGKIGEPAKYLLKFRVLNSHLSRYIIAYVQSMTVYIGDNMAKKWTIERAKELFKQRGCELLETEYVNDSTKMRYIASCGHEHSITLNNFSRGKGDLCRACRIKDNARKESLSYEVIRSAFEKEGCKVLSPEIHGERQKIHYIAQCGHENYIDYGHFHTGGGRVCAKCSKSILYKIDYVREAFEQEDCELLEEEYVNCKTPMRYIAKCGHESLIRFDTFLNCDNATKMCRDCHKHTYHEVPIDRNRTASKVWRKKYTNVTIGLAKLVVSTAGI